MSNPKAKLCAAGITLRKEIDTLWKWRDKASDGWIGNSAHAATKSDHNPDPDTGIVRAIDVDEDLRGSKLADPKAANELVQQLLKMCRSNKEERIAYIIFEGSIWSETYGWKKRKYTGLNSHAHHIHISFKESGDNNGKKFGITR